MNPHLSPSDKVLREPQPHFEIIKRHYPHFIHRHARNGCPVWIELPGRIDLPAIRSGGVSPEALQRHYVFVTEYLWGVVEPDFENGQAVTVLDVQGLGMRDLAGEALGFVKVRFSAPRLCTAGSSRIARAADVIFGVVTPLELNTHFWGQKYVELCVRLCVRWC